MSDADKTKKPTRKNKAFGYKFFIWLHHEINRRHHERAAKNELKRPLDWPAYWTAVATGWIAIFTVVLAVTSYLQWCTMSGQLNEMKGSGQQTDALLCLYRQQLAEMQKQSTDTHNFAVATADQALAVTQSASAHLIPKKTPAFVEFNQPILVPIDILNVGHSRASHVAIKMVAEFIPRTADPDFSYPSKNIWSVKGNDWDVGVSLSDILLRKGSSVSVYDTEGKPLVADEKMVSDYRSGQKDVVLYGEIAYVDVFGVKHWNHFCSVFQNLGEGIIADNGHHKCTNYNQTDSSGLIGKPVQAVTPDVVPPTAPCQLPNQSNPN